MWLWVLVNATLLSDPVILMREKSSGGKGGGGSLILRSLFPCRVKKSLIKYACKKPFFIPFYCLEKVPIGRGFYTRTDESR